MQRRLRAFAIVCGVAVALVAVSTATYIRRALEPGPLPVTAPGPEPFAVLYDLTPVSLTITADWQKVPVVVPAYLLESDRTLWLKMHFEDWNLVPTPIRERGLSAMVTEFRWAADGPAVWRRMSAVDWDAVPQPIRAIAFLRMAEYWSQHYRVGRDFQLPPRTVGETLAAIVMVESWFEHRGTYKNPDGSKDLGLGGASDFCRDRIRQLHDEGAVDFSASDAEYMNPWVATRVLAEWFNLMLDEASGDLPLAIRAYNVGIAAAKSGDGAVYGANVVRKRRRFIRNVGAPPAWTFVFTAMAKLSSTSASHDAPRGRARYRGATTFRRPDPGRPVR